jgi:hypothetical protein
MVRKAGQPIVRCVKTYQKVILSSPRKRMTGEPAYAIKRLLPMDVLGFELNPAWLWDEGYEIDMENT